MPRPNRLATVLLTVVLVLAVSTPTVMAHDQVDVSVTVSDDDTSYTVTVTHNESAVNGSAVNVTPTDTNATYAGADGTTDENGTVTFGLPESETEVEVTATFENHTATETFVLPGANETANQEAFGQRLTSWLHNLIEPGNNTLLGQTVSEWVTANNPGAEHRSDKANPGDNGSGPPEHAVNKSADADN